MAFKMKGTPMKRNFGIGASPVKKDGVKPANKKYEEYKKRRTRMKAIRDANPDAFIHTIRKYGYDKQSAFYSDAFGVKDFYFIVIEKTSPYNIGVYKCSEETINSGRIKYKNLLCVYKNYFIEKNQEVESFLWQREI